MNGFAIAAVRSAVATVILLAAALCRADGAPQGTRPMENRFLFIIDTSSAMRSRANGVEQAVAGLLKSDMRGEFRKGDTLGVWTYNDDLHADFPMQLWSEEKKDEIAGDVLRYLRHQRYENRAHLDKVLRAIGQVMEDSERLTVIFIYDGSEPIRGTDFDVDINELQKKYAKPFRSAHMPMVTVLAARNGQVFDYTINYPASVTVPHTAIALPPPETNAPPAVAVAATPPTNAIPAEPSPPRRKIEIVMSGTTNLSRTIPLSESEASDSPPVTGNIVMSAPKPPEPPPATATPASIVAEAVPTNTPPPAPQPEPAAPQPVAATAQPEPALVLTPAPTNVLATPAPHSTQSATSAPVAATAPVPAPLPPPATATAPVAGPLPAPAPPAGAPTGQQVALFVIAFSLLTIAVVLVVFMVRRWRGDASPSLISQSIDRGR